MKIITTSQNPIIYSNAFGDGSFLEKARGFVQKQGGEGGVLEKIKGVASKGQGGINTVGSILGSGQQQQQQAPQYTPPPPPPPPKGMSKGLKIGLIVGGSVLVLAIVGLVIYKSRQGK
jgi:hypothetical protein